VLAPSRVQEMGFVPFKTSKNREPIPLLAHVLAGSSKMRVENSRSRLKQDTLRGPRCPPQDHGTCIYCAVGTARSTPELRVTSRSGCRRMKPGAERATPRGGGRSNCVQSDVAKRKATRCASNMQSSSFRDKPSWVSCCRVNCPDSRVRFCLRGPFPVSIGTRMARRRPRVPDGASCWH